jgi:hypothetical protein
MATDALGFAYHQTGEPISSDTNGSDARDADIDSKRGAWAARLTKDLIQDPIQWKH